MSQLLINPKFLQFTDNGRLLSGGKVYTYEAGTTTAKTTYSDEALTTPLTNPIVLNARGECATAIYFEGIVKVVLKDASDVTIWTQDNYKGFGNALLSFVTVGTSGQTYTSIGAAIADGATDMWLMEDQTLTADVTIPSGATIHPNGYTITTDGFNIAFSDGSNLADTIPSKQLFIPTVAGDVAFNWATPEVYVAWFGNGDKAMSYAVNSITSGILIVTESLDIDADVTISDDILLLITNNSVVGGAAGTETLTISGDFTMEPRRVFGDGLTVVLGKTQDVFLEWWHDGNGDYYDAWNAAFTALAVSGGTIRLLSRTYETGISGDDWIFCQNNVSVIGQGRSSIVKIPDGNGDYSRIFGASVSGAVMEDIQFRNFTINQNSENGSGYPVVGTSGYAAISMACHDLVVNNMAFDTCCGVNTIYVSGSHHQITENLFIVYRNDDAGDFDQSVIYSASNNRAVIANNVFYSDLDEYAYPARTAIEAHNGAHSITGNLIDGFRKGMNITGMTSGTAQDNPMTITGNVMQNCNNGILLWAATDYDLDHVVIVGNSILIDQITHDTTSCVGIGLTVSATVTGSHKNLMIANNVISFKQEANAGRAGITSPEYTYGIGLCSRGNYENIIVTGNMIINSPCTGIRLGVSGSSAYDVTITNNIIKNPGQNIALTDSYRVGLFVTAPAGSVFTNVRIEGNTITDEFATVRLYRYFYVSTDDADEVNECTFRNNTLQCTGATAPGFLSSAEKLFAVYAETANRTLPAHELFSEKNYSNKGAAGAVTLTLPEAKVGMEARFSKFAAQDFMVDPSGTELIRGSSAGKYVLLTDVGDYVALKCISAGYWNIVGSYGTIAFEA